MDSNKIIVYTDGGARGNPGPAAVGVVVYIKSKTKKELYEYSRYIGESTNNIAEYQAVILALENIKKMLKSKSKNSELEINVDSELLYRQVRGEYRVKMPHLKPLVAKVKKLSETFKKVDFNLVRREQNREADQLVNEALDKN